MTTVAEFKAFLDQFPDDTEVRVLEVDDATGFSGESHRWVDFDPTEFGSYDFVDFTTSGWIHEGHPLRGKKILDLGVD